MYKFILAVAVISLSACAAKETQGEVAADSTAAPIVITDSTAKFPTANLENGEIKMGHTLERRSLPFLRF